MLQSKANQEEEWIVHGSGWAAREGRADKVTKSRDLKEGKEPTLWTPCGVVHAVEIVSAKA